MLQEFVDQVEKAARSVMEEMHTAIPGKMQPPSPTVTGVPVIIPQCPSANVQIAFPIITGMDCLVIVSEQELDAWLGGGESENDMRFDLTSAIALPGLSNKGSSALKEACTTGNVIVSNGSTKLSVSKSGVEIIGNLDVKGNISCTGSYPG